MPVATNLTAQASGTTIYLNWNGASQSDTFNIYRSTTPSGEGAVPVKTGVIYDTGGDSNAGFDYSESPGGAAGTTYYYQVTEVSKAGEGAKSNEASATLNASLLPPAILKAVPGNAQVTLTWSAVPNATSYNLYRYITGTNNTSSTLYKLGLTTTTFPDTSVINNTNYTYYVDAVNASGQGLQSNPVTATPGAATPQATSLTAQASGSYIYLTWNGASQSDTCNIYRSTTPGGEGAVPIKTGILYDNGNSDNNPGFQFVDTPGPTSGTYYYQVTEVSKDGEGLKSNEASATLNATLLTAPTGLTATPDPNGGASIALAWNSVTNATSYNIFRYDNKGNTTTAIQVGVTGTTFTDTNVAYGPIYTYTVRAVNTSGQGNFASASAALKGFGLVAAPKTLTITRGTMQAVTISATPSSGFTGPVALSGNNLPSGVTAWFYPSTVILPTINLNPWGQVAEYQAGLPGQGIGGTVSSGLYLAVSSNATPGTYTLNISGTGGTFTGSTTVTVTIQ